VKLFVRRRSALGIDDFEPTTLGRGATLAVPATPDAPLAGRTGVEGRTRALGGGGRVLVACTALGSGVRDPESLGFAEMTWDSSSPLGLLTAFMLELCRGGGLGKRLAPALSVPVRCSGSDAGALCRLRVRSAAVRASVSVRMSSPA
jgi:hypothetical protein